MSYRLHNYWRSSAGYRVRIALGLKGVAWTYEPVNIVGADGGEQHGVAYRIRNPLRQVPTLELADGRMVTQSLAIIELLDELHPEPALLPRDPYLRARARALAEVVNSGIQPLQNLTVTRRLEQEGVDPVAWVKGFMSEGLNAFDALVTDLAGTCCVGDAPSVADLCLVPQLFSARRFGVSLEGLPRLTAIERHLEATYPAFAAAHPDRQPDAVKA